MASSNQLLFKPVSDKGSLVLLAPSVFNDKIASVDILDSQGNVIESGNYTGIHNGNRGHYRFRNTGDKYAGNNVRITFKDNKEPVIAPVGSGERFRQDFNSSGVATGDIKLDPSGPGSLSNAGIQSSAPTQSQDRNNNSIFPGPAGTTLYQSEGGNIGVLPPSVDYSSIRSPFIDYQANIDRARQEGAVSRDVALDNIYGSRDPALDLIGTDIAGTTQGLDAFIPRVRAEEDYQQQASIDRARLIDESNLSRIPSLNKFNREQVAQSNLDRTASFEESQRATGLDFKRKSRELLDRLEERSRTGKLGGELDASLSKELANRGAEIGLASGISPISRAGMRASDRLTIGERVNLALDAESKFANEQVRRQGLLTAPQEQAPTILAQPTQVPLERSTVAQRVPITPNISAGVAQQNIASQLTSLEALPASMILSGGVGVDQFNETSAYNRDLTVLGKEQGFLTATGNAIQASINADKADELREQQFELFREGQEILRTAQEQQTAGRRRGSGDAAEGLEGLGRGDAGRVVDAAGRIVDAAGRIVAPEGDVQTNKEYLRDLVFGEDGKISIGGWDFTAEDVDKFLGNAEEFFGIDLGLGNIFGTDTKEPRDINGSPIIYQEPRDDGSILYEAEDGSTKIVKPTTSVGTKSATKESGSLFERLTRPLENIGLDSKTLASISNFIQSSGNLTPSQQLSRLGSIGTDILENKGVLDSAQARKVRNISNSLGIILDPNASEASKASAFAEASTGFLQTSFTGSINDPTTIGGNPVVGSTTTPDGDPAYMVMNPDGSTYNVAKETLVTSSNTANAFQAFSVIASDASTEDKLRALTGIGIRAAEANEIITQAQGGSLNAALSIFNTATKFDEMNDLQRAVSVTQTTNQVVQSMSELAGVSSAVGTATSGASSLAGLVLGSKTALDTISAIDDIPTSRATKTGAKGGAMSGGLIGSSVGSFLPVGSLGGSAIGSAIGAVTGATIAQFGTGKGSGQLLRDSWRKGLQAGGFSDKGHNVTLADGSTYNIGLDGTNKLENKGKNLDGRTTRNTFDVDWSNPVAVNSIPEAHVFAIATGLDPTSNGKFDLFNRAVAQSLNAGTSNAGSIDDVRGNFRSMLSNAGDGTLSAPQVAMRIETLRATNKISEQEYGIYLNSVNKIFGTNIMPSDKDKVTQYLINSINNIPAKDRPKYTRNILGTLTDPKKLADAQKQLENRLQNS